LPKGEIEAREIERKREEDKLAAKKAVTAPARSPVRQIATPVEVRSPTEVEPSIEVVVASGSLDHAKTTEPTAPPAASPDTANLIAKLKTEDKFTMENAIKSTEEIVTFSQGNVEAVLKSSQIWATGVQDLGKHFAATAQAQLDETMATVKALSSVKSLKEAMDLQSQLTKTAMEKMIAESGKLTDASMKLAEQTIAPIAARVTLATEKFGRTV
jgi:phasin family protein